MGSVMEWTLEKALLKLILEGPGAILKLGQIIASTGTIEQRS